MAKKYLRAGDGAKSDCGLEVKTSLAGMTRKETKDNYNKIIDCKRRNPRMTQGEIANSVGVSKATVNRVLKKWEEEFGVIEADIKTFTDNKELVLSGLSKKIVERMYDTLPTAKFRELGYALKQVEDIIARDKGQLTGSGDLMGMMSLIDKVASARLKKSETITVDAEITEEKEEEDGN